MADGQTDDVIEMYQSRQKNDIGTEQAQLRFDPEPAKGGQITTIRVMRADGKPSLRFGLLDPINVELEFELYRDFSNLLLELQLWGSGSTLLLASLDSDYGNFSGQMRNQFPRKAGRYRALLEIPVPLLNRGLYELELILTPGPERLDTRRGIYVEVVDNGSYLSYVTKSNRGGLLSVPLQWDIRRQDEMREHQEAGVPRSRGKA